MVGDGDEVDEDTLDNEDECSQQATGSLIFVPKLVKSMHVYIHLDYNGEKVICYVNEILHLVGNQCKTCSIPCTVTTKVVGCALSIKMVCNAGHKFTWASSPILRNIKQSAIYRINLDFTSSLLLSGNNFYKIQQFCRFLGVNCVSPSTYFTYQRLCLCPVISEYYSRKMVSNLL